MPDKLATHVGIKSEFDKRGTGLVQIVVAICFGWMVWGHGRGVDSICVCLGSLRVVGKSGNADLRSVWG